MLGTQRMTRQTWFQPSRSALPREGRGPRDLAWLQLSWAPGLFIPFSSLGLRFPVRVTAWKISNPHPSPLLPHYTLTGRWPMYTFSWLCGKIYVTKNLPTSFFCMWIYSFCSTIWLKTLSFPLVLAFLWKTNWLCVGGFISRFSSIPLVSVSVRMLGPHSFDYFRLEISKYDPLTSSFFFKVDLVIYEF